MRKMSAILLAVLTAFSCGCAAEKNAVNFDASEKLSIVTTIFPAYDFAKQVFGDTAEVTMLLKPGTESHTYDPTARDVITISGCDLFIYNGGESDSWVEGILDAVGDIDTLRMMDAVTAIEEEYSEGMQEDEHEEHEEHEYDEHIWTSPANAALIVDSIKTAACGLAPENTDLYEQSAGEYIDRINSLDERFAELLEGEKRFFVFGDRFPLLYFFKEYDLNYYAAFPGCGSETEPSAQTISFLLNKLDEDDTVKTVFYIELSNHKLADTLAEDKNLPTAEIHTCHNITAEDFAAGESYVTLMERNYEVLKTALEK